MSIFDLHAAVLQDYKDFVRSSFTGDVDVPGAAPAPRTTPGPRRLENVRLGVQRRRTSC